MIAHVQHYFEDNNEVKELIRSGKYGKLASITDIRNVNYFDKNRPKWFLNKKLSGGGILLNYGSHSLDKINWITGLEIVGITGKVFQHLSEYEIEGNAQLFVNYENNVSAIISYSGYNCPPENETTFYLTNGVIKLKTGQGVWVSQGGEFTKVDVEPVDRFLIMWNDFINSIINNTVSPVTGEYGMKIIRAIETVYSIGE